MAETRGKQTSNIQDLDYEALKELHESGEGVNYKELCRRLDIPILGGDSKKKQLKELTGVMKYEKEGIKFFITELCTHEVMDMFNNRATYLPYIQLILTDLFIKSGKDNIYLTTKDMIQELGMVNENYIAVLNGNMFDNCNIVANKFQYDNSQFYSYMSNSYNKLLKGIIRSSLESMENSMTIETLPGYCMTKKVKEFGMARYIQDYTNVTEKMGSLIFEIEGDVLTQFGLRTRSDLHSSRSNIIDEYYKECHLKLREATDNKYDSFHRCKYIHINQKRLASNISELKNQLRGKVLNRFQTAKCLKNLTGEEMERYIRDTVMIKPINVDYSEAIKQVHIMRRTPRKVD